MCTLTYLPLQNQQFLLTTNRDESPLRPQSIFPAYKHTGGKNILYPKDPQGGGSWVAAADNGTTVCLLNGADEPHEHKPPYKISRGLVLLEAIECIKPNEFFENYDFEGIEPFTLIVLFYNTRLQILEFKWNGKNKGLSELTTDKPHIWASAQLYNKTAINNRRKWFAQWLAENHDFNTEEIMKFHKNAGSGDLKNDMIMDRGLVKTVSTTSVASKTGRLCITHENLLDMTVQEICICQHLNQAFSS